MLASVRCCTQHRVAAGASKASLTAGRGRGRAGGGRAAGAAAGGAPLGADSGDGGGGRGGAAGARRRQGRAHPGLPHRAAQNGEGAPGAPPPPPPCGTAVAFRDGEGNAGAMQATWCIASRARGLRPQLCLSPLAESLPWDNAHVRCYHCTQAAKRSRLGDRSPPKARSSAGQGGRQGVCGGGVQAMLAALQQKNKGLEAAVARHRTAAAAAQALSREATEARASLAVSLFPPPSPHHPSPLRVPAARSEAFTWACFRGCDSHVVWHPRPPATSWHPLGMAAPGMRTAACHPAAVVQAHLPRLSRPGTIVPPVKSLSCVSDTTSELPLPACP